MLDAAAAAARTNERVFFFYICMCLCNINTPLSGLDALITLTSKPESNKASVEKNRQSIKIQNIIQTNYFWQQQYYVTL